MDEWIVLFCYTTLYFFLYWTPSNFRDFSNNLIELVYLQVKKNERVFYYSCHCLSFIAVDSM